MYIECLNRLNHDIHILRFFSNKGSYEDIINWESKFDKSFKSYLTNIVSTWDDVVYNTNEYETNRFSVFNGIVNPIKYSLRLRKELIYLTKESIDKNKPDFIWANHIGMSSVVAFINPKVPWLTSHHDWLYKLRILKKPNSFRNYRQQIKYSIETWIQKKIEIAIIKKSNITITGSKTELNEIQQKGAQNSFLVPSCFEKVDIPNNKNLSKKKFQIIHLGGISTTANRIGLDNYFKWVHPKIQSDFEDNSESIKVVIIGDMEQASESMKANFSQSLVQCLGYVRNLYKVIKPYDVGIIPYDENTGTRTKIALYFAHKLVVIAVKKSVLGFPNLINGKNIILIDKITEMNFVISSLLKDFILRKKIGENAKSTYDSYLTWEKQVPLIDEIIENIKVN